MTCRDNLTRSARSHLNLIETEYSASEIATSLARPAKPMPCVDAQHSHSIAAGSIAAEVLPAPQGSMAGGSLTASNAPPISGESKKRNRDQSLTMTRRLRAAPKAICLQA
ncbi:MAG TPA: hypothetical protein DEF45_01635 [Rhodopirellula sp.]|nr:hypothetical protein [Rhodopirellula sp.]